MPIIKQYQLSNSRIREKISHKCVVRARHLTSSQCTVQSARQFCDISWVSLQDRGVCFWFCERTALIGTTVCPNQQRKSSSLGRTSESQKHPTTCVSVHGGGPFCQLGLILVSCLKLYSHSIVSTVSVTVWYAVFAWVMFVIIKFSSCVMSGASVTVWYRRHGSVKLLPL